MQVEQVSCCLFLIQEALGFELLKPSFRESVWASDCPLAVSTINLLWKSAHA